MHVCGGLYVSVVFVFDFFTTKNIWKEMIGKDELMVLRKQLWLDDYGVTNEMKYIRLRQLAFPSHPKSFHISGRNPFLFHKSRAKISGALVRGKRFPPCVPIKDLPTSQGKVPLQEKCTLLSRVLRRPRGRVVIAVAAYLRTRATPTVV